MRYGRLARLFASLLALALMSCAADTQSGGTSPARSEVVQELPELVPAPLAAGERLRVVASTSIVADVVANVGGGLIGLTTLAPVGSDPHAFEPTPRDAAAVSDAHVVFIVGLGLETFVQALLDSVEGDVPVIAVSQGIELHATEDSEEHSGEDEHGHEGDVDPHTWFDPNHVATWTRNIERALSALDPANATTYASQAAAYRAELQELDAWIGEQVSQVPPERRKLVTDHTAFGHFARRYGFDQVGAVFPGYSTLTEPSAQELAALEDAIRTLGVRAIFVSQSANPKLAQRVAADTGTELVYLYTGSLSAPDGPASTYVLYMRYNVSAIVGALH